MLRVPTLASVYALFWCYAQISVTCQHLKAHKPYGYVVLGAAHGITMLVLFLGYWVESLVRPLGPLAAALFLFFFVWACQDFPRALKALEQGDFTPEMNRMHKALWGTVGVILELPVLWFGGIAAWRAL